MLQLLCGLFYRQNGFQRLYHGGTIVSPNPFRQLHQLIFHADALLYQPLNVLHPGRVEAAGLTNSHAVSFRQLVSVAKGNKHTHTNLQHIPEFFGNPVLKGSIQFFMCDIHYDIRIPFLHCTPLMNEG